GFRSASSRLPLPGSFARLNFKNLPFLPITQNKEARMIRCVVFCLLLSLSTLAWGQGEETSAGDILTLEQAVDLAVANDFSVENARLEVKKAGASVAALRTRRLPELSFHVLESRPLTRESYKFEPGVFGSFPGIGPIPPTNTNIETTPQFTTTV